MSKRSDEIENKYMLSVRFDRAAVKADDLIIILFRSKCCRKLLTMDHIR